MNPWQSLGIIGIALIFRFNFQAPKNCNDKKKALSLSENNQIIILIALH